MIRRGYARSLRVAALSLAPGEDKDLFLERARAAVIRLAS